MKLTVVDDELVFLYAQGAQPGTNHVAIGWFVIASGDSIEVIEETGRVGVLNSRQPKQGKWSTHNPGVSSSLT